jgi:LacI family transcriptional regulator
LILQITILNGVIVFLINQKPLEQGYKGVEILYRFLASNQEHPKNFNIPVEVITIENFKNNDETRIMKKNLN